MKSFIANAIVAGLMLGGAAFADTIYVYEGEVIQHAIDSASDGDEIIVGPGTHRGDPCCPASTFFVLNMRGKQITLRSSDGPESTILDGENARAVIWCISGETSASVIDGFTVTNGKDTGSGPGPGGGGIYCDASAPTIKNCRIINNRNSGIFWKNGPWSAGRGLVEGCLISGNTSYEGAGIAVRNSL